VFDISAVTEHFPLLGLFALLILGGIGLPFPEDTTLILAGFLISHHVIKMLPSLIVVFIGALIADMLIFFAGRKYGRRIVEFPRFRKIMTVERLLTVEKRFRKHGALFILAGRHLIGLRAQLFLVAGVMKMPVLKFVLADAISLSLTVAVMVGAGYVGGNSLQILKKDISRVEHVLIFLAVIVLGIVLLLRYFRSGKGSDQ